MGYNLEMSNIFTIFASFKIKKNKTYNIMFTYEISFKDEMSKGEWRTTTYVSSEPRSKSFLIDFFGLNECEEFKIKQL